LEVLVLVGQAVDVLDGFIDRDIVADELLVFELDTLEVAVFEIFIVFVLNEVRDILAELLDVLDAIIDLVLDVVAVDVFDKGAERLIVGDDELVLETDVVEDVVFVLVTLLVLDGLEVAVLDDVVVVDTKADDELVYETVPVLVEVLELGIVFDIYALCVLIFDGLALLVLVVVFVEVFEDVDDNVGIIALMNKFLL